MPDKVVLGSALEFLLHGHGPRNAPGAVRAKHPRSAHGNERGALHI